MNLFDIEYTKIAWKECKWWQGCIGDSWYIWAPTTITPKPFSLLSQRVDVVNWDLDKYAPTIVVTFQEVDASQTITDKETVTTEFAANFANDQGIWKKIGLKFGASQKQTRVSERTVVTSLGSDDLGESTIEFGDDVVTGNLIASWYITRRYSTGTLFFSMEPARVQ